MPLVQKAGTKAKKGGLPSPVEDARARDWTSWLDWLRSLPQILGAVGGAAAALTALFGAWLALNPITAPSFPCSQAKNKVENLICRRPDLASLDVRLDDYFVAARDQAGAGRGQLIREEHDWILQRNACENFTDMAACVEAKYRERIPVLQELLRHPPVPHADAAPKSMKVDSPPMPSFSCFAASSAVDDVICSNSALARLDVTVNDAYLASRMRTPPEKQPLFERDQANWRRDKRDACRSASDIATCVERAYQARLSELRAYMSGLQ